MGDLARSLRVSVPYVSDVEHNRRPPLTHERIEQVAALFNIDPTELLLSAASHKGHVALETDTDRRRDAAAALARGWTQYTDDELVELRQFAEEIRSRKGGE